MKGTTLFEPPPPGIGAEGGEVVVPASSFQERIWLAERLEPGTPLYNVPMAWRVRGKLEPGTLGRALRLLVERHEILRTRFVQRDGRLQQVVGPAWSPRVEWEDLGGLAPEERDERLAARLREVAHRRFDPGAGRLLAVALLEIGEATQVLAVCLHHLAWDEGSTPIFLRDLAACYERARAEASEGVARGAGPGPADPGRHPASPHQERMAFIDRFETGVVYPHPPVYHNLPLLLRLPDPVDRAALEAAVSRVTARHEALRTTLELSDRGVVQAVGPPSPAAVSWLEPAAEAGDDPPRTLREWWSEPFDLGRGPLFHVAVLPVTGGGSWLALVGHLAVVDRVSLEIVARELLEILAGREATLPRGSSYAAWWRDLDHHRIARDVEAVAGRLGGEIEPLRLPESRPRPSIHVYDEGTVAARLGPGVDLGAAALAAGADTEAVLLAGFAVLLSLYAGQDDLVIGTVSDARGEEDARLVGPVANLLPVRVRPRPEKSFGALLAETHTELAALRRHRLAPFDEVVKRVDPDKDMSRTALFDVLFQVSRPLRLGVGVRALQPGTGYGKYDLHLFVEPSPSGHAVRLLYNRVLFGRTAMREMVGHYRRVLEQATGEPDRPLGRIELVGARERHRQVVAWNDTAASYPHTTVVKLLRGRARERPDAAALVRGGGTVTYGALLRRVEELAAGLIASGVRPGDPVVLRLERGASQVEAMLAVLFAGGLYVPVATAAPEERLGFVLDDSGARFVVVDEGAAPGAWRGGRRVLTPHGLRAAAGAAAPAPPVPSLDAPAYCIYTSGTTGRPKGVVVTHRNLVRLLCNDRLPFDFGTDDTWTLFHSYAFDFSVWELFGCLVHGGRLLVVDRDVARDAQRFWSLVRRERVTVLNQTPSAFAALVREAEAEGGRADSLRYVIFGGEALRPRTLSGWHDRHPRARLVNMYGITETTVHVTVHTLAAEDLRSDAGVVGSPIPTTTVHLLDPRGTGRLLPVGAVGEIHVGGAGVARGYLGRPALEALRFVPDPFGSGRLFRSGDLARWRGDGTLEFLGRADSQLKVRGYRIEPGEIESRLREHPAVADAVVRLEGEVDRVLVAYVQPRGEAPAPGALRGHLAARLPEYMVPAAYRAVDSIPLTENGKLDTRALRARGRPLEDAGGGRPPATPTARALAALWSELLGGPSPGADDSFFERGGHSLLGARLLSRVAERFGVELPLRRLFEHPRLQDLADLIDRELPEEGAADGAAPGGAPEATLLPASSFQERLWLAERLDPGAASYAVPLAWRVRGRLDPSVLRRALARVTERQEILRTRFVERAGVLHQAISTPWTPELETEDLSGLAPERVRRILEARLRTAAGRPLDPRSGRLVHAGLADLPGGEQALFLCFHHLVWDAGSALPFLRELAACYALEAGERSTLDPPGPQYRAFVRARRLRRESGTVERGLAYWTEALRGAPSELALPPPEVPEPHGAVELPLGADLLERLRPLQVERGVSWFMVAAAALAALLHRATASDVVTFGCPLADRDDEELEDVVGPCLNTVILPSRVEPGTTLSELMDRMRDAVLEALDHKDVPFEDVVRRLQPERRPGRTPYADVVLNVYAAPSGWPEVGGHALRGLELRSQWELDTKFALTVTLAEEAGRLQGVISYRGDRVSRRAVEELAGRLARLLERFVQLLGQPVADLDAVLRPSEGAAPAGGPGATQYRDFVRRQIARRDSASVEAGLDHWVRHLDGAPPYLAFPRPPRPGPSGGVDVSLAPDLLARLRPVQRSHGVTWPMIAATALAALLHRWTAQDDVTFGAPVARREGELAEVLGPCLNTVVVRSRCRPETTLGRLLEDTKAALLDALEHQDVPFEAVVERLNPPRRAGWSPYIDVTLALDAAPDEPPRLGGAELEELALEHREAEYLAKFGLTVGLTQAGGRLAGLLGYRGDRVTRPDAEQLARLLARILERFASSLETPVAALDLVDEEERARLAAMERGAPAGEPASVPSFLACQVRARPDAVAVESDRGALTYRALDRRARVLAARLRPLVRGTTPVVALALGRGADLVVAMLAAWKAGCAFCPIDLGYPEARIDFMLRDLEASAVVTDDAAVRERLEGAGVPVLGTVEPPGTDRNAGGEAAGEPSDPDPEALAYVIYTSGSTGEPKGVPIRHRNLAQYVRWYVDAFAVDPSDRTSLVSSVGFDLSECEIWCALGAGACVVPYERSSVVATALAPWLEERRVTLGYAPTVLAEALWATGAPLPGLRWLFFAGSALTRRPPERLGHRLCNAYGPTETTIIVSSHELEPDGGSPLNCIGRPIAGARLYVVDEAGGRCPRGVPGEIHIGGAGVAGRYWRRPELSRERFLTTNPDGELEPVYRTGDLGRWLPDGTLEFLGRLDRQLKIRGYRVEPQEIEVNLQEDPLVDAAAVLPLPGDPPSLVGYLVPHPGAPRDTRAVLERLAARLPSFMVPGALVWLDALPTTAHGKLDVDRLPRPGRGDVAGEVPWAEPRTELERRIAGVWSSVLRLDRVGVHDNFFDLGGHSILLSTLHARLEGELERPIPIETLFEFPTVSALARALADGPGEAPASGREEGAEGMRERAARGRRARALRARRQGEP